MASQVLSGTSNPSYTNNTGQNVRVVINYMRTESTSITLNWAGVSATANLAAIGRNLAYATYVSENISPYSVLSAVLSLSGSSSYTGKASFSNNNALAVEGLNSQEYSAGFLGRGGSIGNRTSGSGALPTELILAPGQTFSAVCGVYNIVVIPEAG